MIWKIPNMKLKKLMNQTHSSTTPIATSSDGKTVGTQPEVISSSHKSHSDAAAAKKCAASLGKTGSDRASSIKPTTATKAADATKPNNSTGASKVVRTPNAATMVTTTKAKPPRLRVGRS